MYKSLNTGHLGIKVSGFQETIKLAKRHGYGAISYSPEALEKEGLDTHKALDIMGQHGVLISDFGLPMDITSNIAFNDSYPRLEKVARQASKLGISRCTTWMLSYSNDYEYAENFKRHVKMFRLIAETLGEYNIRFGAEFLGPKTIRQNGKHPFIHSLDKMLELCDAVGTGNIGVLLDSHHCYVSGLKGGEFAKLIRNEKDIVSVHINDSAPGEPLNEIKDSPRYYPGEPGSGANDLPAFMQALQDIAYTGPVAVEPFSEGLKNMSDEEITKLISNSTDNIWPLF